MLVLRESKGRSTGLDNVGQQNDVKIKTDMSADNIALYGSLVLQRKSSGLFECIQNSV